MTAPVLASARLPSLPKLADVYEQLYRSGIRISLRREHHIIEIRERAVSLGFRNLIDFSRALVMADGGASKERLSCWVTRHDFLLYPRRQSQAGQVPKEHRAICVDPQYGEPRYQRCAGRNDAQPQMAYGSLTSIQRTLAELNTDRPANTPHLRIPDIQSLFLFASRLLKYQTQRQEPSASYWSSTDAGGPGLYWGLRIRHSSGSQWKNPGNYFELVRLTDYRDNRSEAYLYPISDCPIGR